jgi:hypothetical protein
MELSGLEQSKSSKKYFYNTMSYRSENMERIIPVFLGILGSLVLCAFVVADTAIYHNYPVRGDNNLINYSAELEAIGTSFLSQTERPSDPIMEYYKNSEYKEWVINFFTSICSNKDISVAILAYSEEFDVPAALAFALSWEESRFNPRAINRYNWDGSIDRGLFQLNNRSFPHLDNTTFFDIRANSRYGISHLRYCLDTGGTEVSALAMYNAGAGRVTSTGAPKVTLNYISRILENRAKIESLFHSMLISEEERRMTERSQHIPREQNQSQNHFSRTLTAVSPL